MKKHTKIILAAVILALLCSLLGWVWYDNNVDRSGWLEKDGVAMYADFHGKPLTGWQDIGSDRYYFREDGRMHTGWLDLDGNTYFLNLDGSLRSGWLEQGDIRFYLSGDGIPLTGWQNIDGQRYYFSEEGCLHTGWLELENSRHYFAEDGTLRTGWLREGETSVYLDENGTPVTGWLELDGSRYYFGEDGEMVTGWAELDGIRCCFGSDGVLFTGWQDIDGSRYYFGEDGAMHTGWLQEGEYRYYLLSDGTMATAPTEIDGRTQYFTPKGIWVMLVNPWNPLPEDYAPDLVAVENGHQVDSSCYDALTRMLEDCAAAGLYPAISSSYRTEADQLRIWDEYVDMFLEAGYDTDQANAMTSMYVAIPGTSEHHMGLALDIVGMDYFHEGYPNATANVHGWLREHCWEYGFILRYLEDKQSITGFAPEAWHFRYVGTEVSMELKDTGLCLEEYLGATQ